MALFRKNAYRNTICRTDPGNGKQKIRASDSFGVMPNQKPHRKRKKSGKKS